MVAFLYKCVKGSMQKIVGATKIEALTPFQCNKVKRKYRTRF